MSDAPEFGDTEDEDTVDEEERRRREEEANPSE